MTKDYNKIIEQVKNGEILKYSGEVLIYNKEWLANHIEMESDLWKRAKDYKTTMTIYDVLKGEEE